MLFGLFAKRTRRTMCGTPATHVRTTTLLSRDIRLVVSEDQVRLAARQVKHHLREVAVRPRKPRASVRRSIVYVDRLVNETKSGRVLHAIHTVSADYAKDNAVALTFTTVYK